MRRPRQAAEYAGTGQREPYGFTGDPTSCLVATAIHAGHDVRPEISSLLRLDEATRLREEDPFTDRIAAVADSVVLVYRSRFEVDLNRGREAAVYRQPDDCWGLDPWGGELPQDVIDRSLDIYDAFYADLGTHLDRLAEVGPFLVFDVHSYNHRRPEDGRVEAPQSANPDVNVGTGSLDGTWSSVVDSLIDALGQAEVGGRPLDVRENIRFEGANLAEWVNERYPTTGCALALEFKKTFMDEWTGAVDVERLDALIDALRAATPPALDALRRAA
jgi:N-formylglutamate amidohydrolase